MDADRPGPGPGGEGGDRRGRRVAFAGGRQGGAGAGQDVAEEAFAGGGHQQRAAQRVQLVQVCDEGQVVGAFFAKPRPGSITTRSGSRPPAITASIRCRSSARTSATTSSYTARLFMDSLKPRQCITTNGTSAAATAGIMSGSARPPLTSLTRTAPAATAFSATRARMVSTETVTPSEASPFTTGMTRRSSSDSSTRLAPGRVDSPPTSTRSAPSDTRSRPCFTAAVVSNQRPPSEKESGVTLTTPMTAQRSHSGSPRTVPRVRDVLIPPA